MGVLAVSGGAEGFEVGGIGGFWGWCQGAGQGPGLGLAAVEGAGVDGEARQ